MNSWFSKNLGDGILASGDLERIDALFPAEYKRQGAPADMAVFIRHDTQAHVHCEVTVYFSPAALAIATALQAIPCPQPSRDNLGLLAGPEECWEQLFQN